MARNYLEHFCSGGCGALLSMLVKSVEYANEFGKYAFIERIVFTMIAYIVEWDAIVNRGR